MPSIIRATAALGAAGVLVGLSAATAAAAESMTVRVVPNVTKTIRVCDPKYDAEIGVQPKYGAIRLSTYYTDVDYISNDNVSGVVDTATVKCVNGPKPYQVDLTLIVKAVAPVTNSFTRTCDGTSGTGTVAFTLSNSDRTRHSVQISSAQLTPSSADVIVPAGATQTENFQIGAANATVALGVDHGRTSTGTIEGCSTSPGGGDDGGKNPVEEGEIGAPGPNTGGGYLAMHQAAGASSSSLSGGELAVGGIGVLGLGGLLLGLKRRKSHTGV